MATRSRHAPTQPRRLSPFTILVLLACAPAAVFAKTESTRPVDHFLGAMESLGAAPDIQAKLRATWQTCDNCDPDEFLTQGLALLAAPFADALDAFDKHDYASCATAMATLTDHPVPVLAYNAAAYQIKALVAAERLNEAYTCITALRAHTQPQLDAVSYMAPEVAFLEGYCLLGELQYDQAHESLIAFLQEYPDAPQRLTQAARQMLADLQHQRRGDFQEVVDLMEHTARHLATADAGQNVQDKQQRILDLLDALIDEAQQQEQSSSQPQPLDRSETGSSQPETPMPDSVLPQSGSKSGTYRDSRQANPGEVWGTLPPAQRERVLQALRDSFPSRYRRLVEQYYEELAKKR